MQVDGDRVRLAGSKRFVVEGDAVDEVVVLVQGAARGVVPVVRDHLGARRTRSTAAAALAARRRSTESR